MLNVLCRRKMEINTGLLFDPFWHRNVMISGKSHILFLMVFQCSDVIGQMEPYIIGGSYTNINAHPHMVYLDADCTNTWKCGGSVLNQIIILTAAHCLYSCNLNTHHKIIVYAGHEKIKSMPVTKAVKRIIIHKNYNEKTVENDIGLALLNLSLMFGRNIKRVIIKPTFPKGVVVGNIAGWGAIDAESDESPIQLKWMQQKLRSKSTCAKLDGFDPGMFCAGSLDNWADRPARGDSGGALIIEKSWEIGILSWNCNRYMALSVYTNVSYYYNWITRHTRMLYCQT